jgi:hypothetical protein
LSLRNPIHNNKEIFGKKELTQCHNLAPSDFAIPQPVQEQENQTKTEPRI